MLGLANKPVYDVADPTRTFLFGGLGDIQAWSTKTQTVWSESSRHRRDSNPQSLPPESNALPLGHGVDILIT